MRAAALLVLLAAALALATPPVSGREVSGVSCQPGATFSLGCDACRCRADGRSAACTNRPCPSDVTPAATRA